MINPYSNREATNRNTARSEAGARWAAVIFTSGGAFIYGKDLAMRYLPDSWEWSPTCAIVAAIAAAGVAAWLTDLMFGDLLQRVVYDLLASRHPNVIKWQGDNYFKSLRRGESIMYAVLLVGLLCFDLYTTLVIREPIADQARAKPIINVDSLRQGLQSSYDSNISALRTDAKEKQKAIASIERKVANSNPALEKLKKDGNAWAANEIARRQRKAIATDEKARASLENAVAVAVTESPKYIASRIAEAETANAEAAAANQRNRAVMSGMYTAFTVVPKALAILLRILMVVTFLAYSSKFHPDLTGDGIIDYRDVEEYYQRQKRAAQARETKPPAGDFDDIGGRAFK